MHVIFRESRGLEETEVATDLGQSPAPLIVLSFSDSDLGAFAAGWHAGAIICLNCVWPIWRR
jgi:cobaltochelatase CobN